jgi:hypothetical protein
MMESHMLTDSDGDYQTLPTSLLEFTEDPHPRTPPGETPLPPAPVDGTAGDQAPVLVLRSVLRSQITGFRRAVTSLDASAREAEGLSEAVVSQLKRICQQMLDESSWDNSDLLDLVRVLSYMLYLSFQLLNHKKSALRVFFSAVPKQVISLDCWSTAMDALDDSDAVDVEEEDAVEEDAVQDDDDDDDFVQDRYRPDYMAKIGEVSVSVARHS